MPSPNQLLACGPKVVIIHGLMESGKSTLAEFLMKECGYERVKFADPLKNMVRRVLQEVGVPADRIELHIEGNLKKTPIAEMNDPHHPEHHLANLPDDLIHSLVEGMLEDAGIDPDGVNAYKNNPELAIAELQGAASYGRLYSTLRNDWSRSMLSGEVITSRRMMQTLGEEWRNLHTPLLWTRIALARTERLLSQEKRVVIDDNRYRFEFEAFTHLRAFRLVVTRGTKHFLPITDDIHPGERPMPVSWFDAHINNDGSIAQLRSAAIQFLNARAMLDHSLRKVHEQYGFGQRSPEPVSACA